MKLTHETLVRANPAQILLPRFTVSQIMRNDQQVSFRIFFTANYNTFTADDYLVVKYAAPDNDGMPMTDRDGYVQFFKPPTDNTPPIKEGDSLIFGLLRYSTDSHSYYVDWSNSSISPRVEPDDMMIEEPLKLVKPPKRKTKTKKDRVVQAVSPTERALAEDTLNSRVKKKNIGLQKSVEQVAEEVMVMNLSIPSPAMHNAQKEKNHKDAMETYASRLADIPDTPLATIPALNCNTSPSSAPTIKDKRYSLTPDGMIIGHSTYDSSADDISYREAIRQLPRMYLGDDNMPTKYMKVETVYNKEMFYRYKKMEFISFTRLEEWGSSFDKGDNQFSDHFADGELVNKEGVAVTGDSRHGILANFRPEPMDFEITEEKLKDRAYVEQVQRYLSQNIYGVPPLSTDYTGHYKDKKFTEQELNSNIIIDGYSIYERTETTSEDTSSHEWSDEVYRLSHFQDGGEATTDDVGGEDDSAEGNPPQTNHEPIPGPPDPDTPSILNPPGSNPQPPPNPDETTEERPPPNPPDSNTPDVPPSAPPNNEDMGGDPSPPPQQNPDENAPPPNPPALNPPPPNSPSSSSNNPYKRQHLRPFKNHYQPGYDPVTGDLVWKVRLGFPGHFDTFEDYVRFFTDAICKRVREEAYMQSSGQMIPDNAEIIDALAMLAQKRLYFRSNPGYVYCYWEHCSPRLRRMFQSPYYFRDHYSRHLYWYLICGTANCTELKDDTYKILIGRHAFIGRGEEVVVNSYTPITIPGNSFFNPMWIEVRDENDELYELQVPYIVEWTFTPIKAA